MGVDGGVVGKDTLGDERLGSGPEISEYDDVCVIVERQVLIWRDEGLL